MKKLKGGGSASAILWADNRSDRREIRLRNLLTLLDFCRFCRRTPDQLLHMRDHTAAYWLKKWIGDFKGARSTKLSYLSTVRSFFSFYEQRIPIQRTWIHDLKGDRPTVEGRLTPKRFAKLLEHCRDDPRTRSLLLVQFQSFSAPREVCTIGNAMGFKLARELRKGADLVRLYFLRHGRRYRRRFYKEWNSYIGKEACDALREWFDVRGWPNPNNPFIWPSRRPHRDSTQRPLTERSVTRLYSRLTARVGLRRRKRGSRGSWVRYGVSAKEVRNLAMALAYQATFKTKRRRRVYAEIVRYFAGYVIDEIPYRRYMMLRDMRFLEKQYRLIEPYLSSIS